MTKTTLFKPANPQPVHGTWCCPTPGPGAVHMGTYTPILKVGKGSTPRDQIGLVFEPPVKPRTTI